MNFQGRPSSLEDRESITGLMMRGLELPAGSAAIEPSFQDWKYWSPHPLVAGSRGYLLHENGRIVGHGCKWPIRLRTPAGDLDGFHLIDWVADKGTAGAGIKVLRDCANGLAAVFSIGGSEMSQKVVSAFGFKAANQVWLLERPLRMLKPAWDSAPNDWKTPARLARNAWRQFFPFTKLAPGWQYESVSFSDIPENLFPRCTSGESVSLHDADVLAHVVTCPRFQSSRAYVISETHRPVAYFVLAQVAREVRMIDFGPAGLNEISARALGACAQKAAISDFADATLIATITTEDRVRDGLLASGFRLKQQKTVRVLALTPAVRTIAAFRLTMIDWDIACL